MLELIGAGIMALALASIFYAIIAAILNPDRRPPKRDPSRERDVRHTFSDDDFV